MSVLLNSNIQVPNQQENQQNNSTNPTTPKNPIVDALVASGGKRSRGGWIAFNSRYPCPVCETLSDKQKCGIHDEKHTIHCFRTYQDGRREMEIEGILYVQTKSNGSGVTFAKKNRATENNSKTTYSTFTRSQIQKNHEYNKENYHEEKFKNYNEERTHNFYSNLALSNTLELNQSHKNFIETHFAIDPELAKKLGFRTNDKGKIDQKIIEIVSNEPFEMEGVIGLKSNKNWNWEWPINSNAILIPSIQNGKYVGFQVKNFGYSNETVEHTQKYLSVGKTDYSVFHVKENGGLEPSNIGRMVITEGIKGIAFAQNYDCEYAVSVRGHNQYNSTNLRKELFEMRNQINEVYFPIDHDSDSNTRRIVYQNARKLMEFLKLLNIRVYTIEWDESEKGVDDAILQQITVNEREFKPRKIEMNNRAQYTIINKRRMDFVERQAQALTIHEIREKNVITDKVKLIFNNEMAKKIRLIRGEPGSGKTTATIYAMKEIFEQNTDFRTVDFVENYEIAYEYLDTLKEIAPDLAGQAMVFHGRDKDHCIQPDTCRKVGNKHQNVTRLVCKQCPLYKDKTCVYFDQIDMAKSMKIVIMTHEQMSRIVVDRENWAGEEIESEIGTFTHFIVDENPIHQFFEDVKVSDNLLHYYRLQLEKEADDLVINGTQEQFNQINTIVKILIASEQMMDYVKKNKKIVNYGIVYYMKSLKNAANIDEKTWKIAMDYINSNDFDRENGAFHMFEKVDGKQVKNNEDVPLVWLKTYITALYDVFVNCAKVHNVSIEQIMDENGKPVFSYKIHWFKEDLIHQMNQKNALILDGTASQFEWSKIAKKTNIEIEIHYVYVKFQKKVKWVLVTGLGGSQQLKKPENKAKVVQMLKSLKIKHKNKMIKTMLTKDLAKLVDDSVKGIQNGYFGRDHKGKNDFQDAQVYVIAPYQTNISAISQEYQIISNDEINLEKTKTVYVPNPYTKQFVQRIMNENDDLNAYVIEKTQTDVYQAVQRLRLGIESENQGDGKDNNYNDEIVVYYFGNPLFWGTELPPFDEIISIEKLNQEMNKSNSSRGGKQFGENFMKDIARQFNEIIKIKLQKTTLTADLVRSTLMTLTKSERDQLRQLIISPITGYPISLKTFDKHLLNMEFIKFMEDVIDREIDVKTDEGYTKEEVFEQVHTIENYIRIFQQAVNVWEMIDSEANHEETNEIEKVLAQEYGG